MEAAHITWRPLGELFVERGLITQDELEEALVEQRETRKRLGTILVGRGLVSGPELTSVLVDQLGMELTKESGFGSGLWDEIRRRHPRANDRVPAEPTAPAAPEEILVVAHKTAATPALLEAIRARAARGPARFHLLVPNPAEHAELTEAERRQKHLEGEHVLALALPLIDEASGAPAEGSVSIRHDPMDAIEETVQDGDFHEIILSTLPRSVSRWLHVDLPSRVAHLGLPVTTVVAAERAASTSAA